ncbi:conserved hypothetical protein [Neospora caninum Liverpool]|uniref:Uncharacterized protein n=1 Tax=Neospora caninum (strain Liverpool) TaxID=572307 RepID=F0VE74_NEOCL|nr:conserved hypothetical protein [Neospora caninum Liverpool]CBZ52018.1 conserved hypothetical protein [Neospora caninum Liverpool]CEL65979.1 TPA: hypothetical protein BN1204_018080 [Neospora caninum Liverpool]|eukprot:XP_003882050.1 conserved hypothetical protein [Neospora caninum Liverpool]
MDCRRPQTARNSSALPSSRSFSSPSPKGFGRAKQRPAVQPLDLTELPREPNAAASPKGSLSRVTQNHRSTRDRPVYRHVVARIATDVRIDASANRSSSATFPGTPFSVVGIPQRPEVETCFPHLGNQPVSGPYEPPTKQNCRQHYRQTTSALGSPGEGPYSTLSSSSPLGITSVCGISGESEFPFGASAVNSARSPHTRGDLTTHQTAHSFVREPPVVVCGTPVQHHLPVSRISSSPPQSLCVEPTPRTQLSSSQGATPASARAQPDCGPSRCTTASTYRQSRLPLSSLRNGLSGSAFIDGGSSGGWCVSTARSSSVETCGTFPRPFDVRHSLSQTGSRGKKKRSTNRIVQTADSGHMPAPRVRTGDTSGDDSHAEEKKRFVDPATYTRLPPEVWVYKYQSPVGLPAASCTNREVSKKQGSTGTDPDETGGKWDSGGSADVIQSSSSCVPPADPGHIGKEIAFPLEHPQGHQQADFLCSSIPILLQVYEVPTLFSLKNGLARTNHFPWPPPCLSQDSVGPAVPLKTTALRDARDNANVNISGREAEDKGQNVVNRHKDEAAPLQSHLSPYGGPLSQHPAESRLSKTPRSTNESRGIGSVLGCRSPREAGDEASRSHQAALPLPPPNGFLARGLQAIHKGRIQQTWWRGLMRTLDVSFSELSRQLKLFAPFHARCVEKLQQSLLAYGEIYDASVADIFSELQTSLLELYKTEVSLRREQRDMSRLLELLEGKRQEAEELRRMLDIHTHLFGLQELDALAVRQAEEEATAADLQWQRLLEHLEAVRLNRDRVATAETWVTRSTGECKDGDLSNPHRQVIARVFPISATLLPHQTFLRGELGSGGYGKLLRINLPPGRWTIGLAITCTAPIDVCLLMLLAQRRHPSLRREGGECLSRPQRDAAPGRETPSAFYVSFDASGPRRAALQDDKRSCRAPTAHGSAASSSQPSIPTLDPSLTLMSATPPEWNAFASLSVHPREAQILHVRTPPEGTPDGGWLLLRVQPTEQVNRRLLDRTAETYANALRAYSCTSPNLEESKPVPSSAETADAGKRSGQGLCVAAPLETENPSFARRSRGAEAPKSFTGVSPGNPVCGTQVADQEVRTPCEKTVKFSIGVHSVFLHPALASKDRGAGSGIPRRSEGGRTEAEGEETKVATATSLSPSGSAFQEELCAPLEESADRGSDTRDEKTRHGKFGVANSSAPPASRFPVPRAPPSLLPRSTVRRDVCVQTVKSSLLRGTLCSLHDGPRPPPVPQFCMCDDPSWGSPPRRTSAGTREATRSHEKASPSSTHPCPSSPASHPEAASASPSHLDPQLKQPLFYAPSFPLLKVLLDDTPVPLGDFSSLLYPPSCMHGERGAAATAPGVLSGARFVRWPLQLLVETAWIVLVQRARERRHLRARRADRRHQRSEALSLFEKHCVHRAIHSESGGSGPPQSRKGGRQSGRRRGKEPSPLGRCVTDSRCCDTDGASARSADPTCQFTNLSNSPRLFIQTSASEDDVNLGEQGQRGSGRMPLTKKQERQLRPNSSGSALPASAAPLEKLGTETNGGGGEQEPCFAKGKPDATEKKMCAGDPPRPAALWRAVQDAAEAAESAKDPEEESLASFTFTFFLRRFGVAFLSHKALHSFLLSLLYYAPLLTPVSPTQQREAFCGKNTRPRHPSLFEFEGAFSPAPNTSGHHADFRASGKGRLCDSGHDSSPVSTRHQRQQVKICSRIRGFLPLFSARLFGRLTGLLSASEDTHPFRQSLDDFLCLALDALVDQIGADQTASRAKRESREKSERAGQAVRSPASTHKHASTSLVTNPGDRAHACFPSRPLTASSGLQREAAQAGTRNEPSLRPRPPDNAGVGLCLAVSHAAAAKIVRRVFHEEGTTEYRLAALEALDSHRDAAVAAMRSRQLGLRARWARGRPAITGEGATSAFLEERVRETDGELKRRAAQGTRTEVRAARSTGRWDAREASSAPVSEREGDSRDSRAKDVEPGKLRSRKMKATQGRKGSEEGWDLLVPADLLIQALTQQWEVLYIHLQQAMERVLDSDVCGPQPATSPILSFNAFSSFLHRLRPERSLSPNHRLSLYRRALFAAASRIHPLCASLHSSSLAALLLHQTHLLAFPLPFPASPFLALGPEPQAEPSEDDSAEDADGAKAKGTQSPPSLRSEDALSRGTPRVVQLCDLGSSEGSPVSPPSLSSLSYECRLAAFIVDALVHFLCTEAPGLLHSGPRDIRQAAFASAREEAQETPRRSEAAANPESSRVAFAAEHKIRSDTLSRARVAVVVKSNKKNAEAGNDTEGRQRGDEGKPDSRWEANKGGTSSKGHIFSASGAPAEKIDGREQREYRLVHQLLSWCASPEGYRPLYAGDAAAAPQKSEDAARTQPASSVVEAFAVSAPIRNLEYINPGAAVEAAKDLDRSASQQNAPAALLLAKIYAVLRDLLAVVGDSELLAPVCYALASPDAHSPYSDFPSGVSPQSPFTPGRGRLSLLTKDQRDEDVAASRLDSETLHDVLRSVWNALERAATLTVEYMEAARTEYQAAAFARMKHGASVKDALRDLARLYRDQVDRLFILSVGSNAFSAALEQQSAREQLSLLYRQSLELERRQLELHDALHGFSEAEEKKGEGGENRETEVEN